MGCRGSGAQWQLSSSLSTMLMSRFACSVLLILFRSLLNIHSLEGYLVCSLQVIKNKTAHKLSIQPRHRGGEMYTMYKSMFKKKNAPKIFYAMKRLISLVMLDT